MQYFGNFEQVTEAEIDPAMFEFDHVSELDHGIMFDLNNGGHVCGIVCYDENGRLLRVTRDAITWANNYILNASSVLDEHIAEAHKDA